MQYNDRKQEKIVNLLKTNLLGLKTKNKKTTNKRPEPVILFCKGFQILVKKKSNSELGFKEVIKDCPLETTGKKNKVKGK